MPHPAAEACLNRPYSARKQKGGTLIDESVVTVEAHRERSALPDGYRPPDGCECGHKRLHAHSIVTRKVAGVGVDGFRRYRCAACRAIWLVLAAFVARWLHFPWSVVQQTVEAAEPAGSVDSAMSSEAPASTVSMAEPRGVLGAKLPSARTRNRWVKRALCSAAMLVQALAEVAEYAAVVADLVGSMRAGLVDALRGMGKLAATHRWAELAAWVHRIVPGIRLL